MGSTVSFVGTGDCVIYANQMGDAAYAPAAQVQQSFTVTGSSGPQITTVAPPAPPSPPAPIVHITPVTLPNSSFKVVGASLSLATYAITFQESVLDPGTFSWVLTFENGKFGVFASGTKGCKPGTKKLKGKCRPSKIRFAKGTQVVATSGTVTFTVRPTKSGIAALKRAFKQGKGLP